MKDICDAGSKVVKGVELGFRMEAYEETSRFLLPRRLPLIIRVDGRAFHGLTQNYNKPFDPRIRDAMTAVATALLGDIQGQKIAYCQSDEVSVLVTDYDTLNSEPWFGNILQKIVSVSASLATRAFNTVLPLSGAIFDARAFVLPREEVTNYFIWRQRDAERNSIQGLGRVYFSHQDLHGLNNNQVKDLLIGVGINWNDLPFWQKHGWCVFSSGPDFFSPRFTVDRNYIERLVHPDRLDSITDTTIVVG